MQERSWKSLEQDEVAGPSQIKKSKKSSELAERSSINVTRQKPAAYPETSDCLGGRGKKKKTSTRRLEAWEVIPQKKKITTQGSKNKSYNLPEGNKIRMGLPKKPPGKQHEEGEKGAQQRDSW